MNSTKFAVLSNADQIDEDYDGPSTAVASNGPRRTYREYDTGLALERLGFGSCGKGSPRTAFSDRNFWKSPPSGWGGPLVSAPSSRKTPDASAVTVPRAKESPAPATSLPPGHCEAEIRKSVDLLFQRGQLIELRIIEKPSVGEPVIRFGYYDDRDQLVRDAMSVARGNVYVTLNELPAECVGRVKNELGRGSGASRDSDVLRRRRLLIDLDSCRPANTSASEEEHAAALEMATKIRRWLSEHHKWPAPVAADSGNGAHLLYALDLENDEESTKLVQRVLNRLSIEFDEPGGVHVDQAVFNAARITKLYGTVARKGVHKPDRPHRVSRIVGKPMSGAKVVTREQLLAFAGPDRPVPVREPQSVLSGAAFDLAGFLDKHLVVTKQGEYTNANGAEYKWNIRTCPLCGESDGSAVVLRLKDGRPGYKCHHNRCVGKGWTDLREHFEPGYREQRQVGGCPPFPKFNLATLGLAHPDPIPVVVDGLFREGDVVNVVAAPKAGKSWLGYGLGLSIVTGRPWLNTFPTTQGRVLLIDNELQPKTIDERWRRVAEAMGLRPEDLKPENLEIWPLRNNMRTLEELRHELETYEPGYFRAIIFDAKYRFATPGASENDNAAETEVYNLLNRIAAHTRAALVLIHHTSKGDQSTRSVTDVGAGAGAQSRAADCHLVLRPHEEEGAVVLDAAVRTFAPIKPVVLRFEYPVWVAAPDLSSTALKGVVNRNDLRQAERDRDSKERVLAILQGGAATSTKIRAETGWGPDRVKRLLAILVQEGALVGADATVGGNSAVKYRLTRGGSGVVG